VVKRGRNRQRAHTVAEFVVKVKFGAAIPALAENLCTIGDKLGPHVVAKSVFMTGLHFPDRMAKNHSETRLFG
jgi:hypothetical protein